MGQEHLILAFLYVVKKKKRMGGDRSCEDVIV